MERKKLYPMLCKSQPLKSAYTLLFTVSTFETAVDVQMRVAVWRGDVGTFIPEDFAFLQLYSQQKRRLLCILLNTASMINLKGYILLNPGVDVLCQPTFTAS